MSQWREVNNGNPCPVCGGKSWCCVSDSGDCVKCMRVPEGSFKTLNDGSGDAYFHRLGGERRIPPTVVAKMDKREKASLSLVQLETFLGVSRRGSSRLPALADELGVPVGTLERMEVGWISAKTLAAYNTKCSADGAYTFPMRDENGYVVGFRLRVNGFKYSLAGGNNGFFIPRGLKAGMKLTVVEGPTDTAAALAFGLNAIGRPNNNALTMPLACLLGRYRPVSVSIMIDRDPIGSKAARATFQGASALRDMLKAYCHKPCRIVRLFDFKDVRGAWNRQARLTEQMEVLYDSTQEKDHVQ